jgi:hypothetical protein
MSKEKDDKITITIEYQAGSDFQGQYLDSLLNVFMEGVKDSFQKHHKKNKMTFIIKNPNNKESDE